MGIRHRPVPRCCSSPWACGGTHTAQGDPPSATTTAGGVPVRRPAHASTAALLVIPPGARSAGAVPLLVVVIPGGGGDPRDGSASRARAPRRASRCSTPRAATASGASTTRRATRTSRRPRRCSSARSPAAASTRGASPRPVSRTAPASPPASPASCPSASPASPPSPPGFRALDPCPADRAHLAAGDPRHLRHDRSLQRQEARPRGVGAALRRALGAARRLRRHARTTTVTAPARHPHHLPRLRRRPARRHRPSHRQHHGWPGAPAHRSRSATRRTSTRPPPSSRSRSPRAVPALGRARRPPCSSAPRAR